MVGTLECKMKLGFDTLGWRHALGGVHHQLSPEGLFLLKAYTEIRKGQQQYDTLSQRSKLRLETF